MGQCQAVREVTTDALEEARNANGWWKLSLAKRTPCASNSKKKGALRLLALHGYIGCTNVHRVTAGGRNVLRIIVERSNSVSSFTKDSQE